ncbi:MAG: DUF4214 domain-containing protein [Saccharofermentans sp.]|nr:DUF4214 domain-containing protein [Saccharofermentans sp.]
MKKSIRAKVISIALAATLLMAGTQAMAAEDEFDGYHEGDTVVFMDIGTNSYYNSPVLTISVPVDGTYVFYTGYSQATVEYSYVRLNHSFSIDGNVSHDSSMEVCTTQQALMIHLTEGEHTLTWTTDKPGHFSFVGDIVDIDEPVVQIGGDLVFDDEDAIEDEIEDVTETPEVIDSVFEQVVPSFTAQQLRMMSARNFVGGLYTEALGRKISEQELTAVMDSIENGKTASEIAYDILNSDEFASRELTDDQFAEVIYATFVMASASSENLASVEDDLNNGMTRAEVIENFMNSEAWQAKCGFYGVNV